MSKGIPSKHPVLDLTNFSRSSFTLTFVVEVLAIDVWHDCNEGWQDLGPCIQGIKLQYQLYPGQNYDVDVMIWPHVAKIWCGTLHGWVRTFLFLERRWLAFSIRHLFPVRVTELINFVPMVTPAFGLGVLGPIAKNDKNFEVYLPPLKFMERRYFATIIDGEDSIDAFMYELVWNCVSVYIPKSYLDGPFDVPYPVKDIRHQDTALYYLKETILNRFLPEEPDSPKEKFQELKPNNRRESKIPKEKEKKKIIEAPKVKYELLLSGDDIIAGTGRVIPFQTSGDRPPEMGEIIILISSDNLPAQDDQPVMFVNIDKLCQIPVAEFKKLSITQLYTRWLLGENEHNSLPQNIRSHRDFVEFNDHHALPLPTSKASEIMSILLDNSYEVQLRGIRHPAPPNCKPRLFGYEKSDRDFSKSLPKTFNEHLDFLIATTKIDARILSKGISGFIRGEYPLYPPQIKVAELNREQNCTNDINGIRVPLKPDLIVQPLTILQAQMTLEVSIGFVGCRSPRQDRSFSRFYGLSSYSNVTIEITRCIMKINENINKLGSKDNLLTGFAIDTGDVVVLFVEGPRDGDILQIWDMTEDFYPKMRVVFSSSVRYSTRIYSEILLTEMPFEIMKMCVPLGVLLACPPVYARPALPLLTRSAILKLGRLVSSKLYVAPCRSEMPTGAELNSFRLELCVALTGTPFLKMSRPRRPKPYGDQIKEKADVVSYREINRMAKDRKLMEKVTLTRPHF